MKCPNCGYEHGWHTNAVTEKYQNHEGEKGDFFEITNGIQAVRRSYFTWNSEQHKEIYGCPSCGSVFLDV